jgi:hypothetical protein
MKGETLQRTAILVLSTMVAALALVMGPSTTFAKESATPTPAQDAARTASVETLETESDCSEPGYECLPDGTIQIEYVDPTGVCTWTMQVDWGDGSPTESKTLPQGGSVTASHTYTEPGLYTIDINFPAGTSSDPENQSCSALHVTRNVEVPAPPDADDDGHPDNNDNCFLDHNPGQEDGDGDGQGDACDDDNDRDGHPDTDDNCPEVPNPSQADSDGDGQGDACDPFTNLDTDKDGESDQADNCMAHSNPGQADGDQDGIGDACDATVGDGGDTTFNSSGARSTFLRTVAGPPIILRAAVQDNISDDGRAGLGDMIVIEFNETMNSSTSEDGATLRLKDNDGTIVEITCGSQAVCGQNKGRLIGYEGHTLKHQQALTIILLGTPSAVKPGTVPGLQNPARIMSDTDKHFKDFGGRTLSLADSRDRTLELRSFMGD